MKIHPPDDSLKIAYPKKINKNEKSTGKKFSAIHREFIENYSKSDAQDQKQPINTISEIQFNTFRPGKRKPVGKVLSVQGKAVIQHKDIKDDYLAKKDLPLFEGDTIATHEKGQIRISLKDGSIMTLTPKSKLVLNRSIYDPKKKTRSSFLAMKLGKARFWVKKMLHFRHSEFRVKTHTAVCGVRGSDFVVMATPKVTEVTTFEDTKLEVISLTVPDSKPTILDSFERTVVGEDSLPSAVEKITFEEAEKMKKELTVTPKAVETEGMVEKREGKIEEKILDVRFLNNITVGIK